MLGKLREWILFSPWCFLRKLPNCINCTCHGSRTWALGLEFVCRLPNSLYKTSFLLWYSWCGVGWDDDNLYLILPVQLWKWSLSLQLNCNEIAVFKFTHLVGQCGKCSLHPRKTLWNYILDRCFSIVRVTNLHFNLALCQCSFITD